MGGNTYSRSKGRSNAVKSFAGIPRIVMESPDYKNLNGGSVKLLLEFACQYRGNNNGNLTAAYSILKERGFNSKGSITRAVDELLGAGLIIRTREGVFINPGGKCALYALSWQPIDDCKGKQLSIQPTTTPPRKFSTELNKTPRPQNGLGSSSKQGRPRTRDAGGKFTSPSKWGRLAVAT
jgi:hypothetical protein